MGFTAILSLARGFLSDTAALAGYVAIGAVQLGVAAWFALAFRYYQARSAALARLDAIAAALDAVTRGRPHAALRRSIV